MSDFYSGSDYEEDTARNPEPMVVEVRGHGTRGSPVTARRTTSRRSTSRNSHRRTDRDYEYVLYSLYPHSLKEILVKTYCRKKKSSQLSGTRCQT